MIPTLLLALVPVAALPRGASDAGLEPALTERFTPLEGTRPAQWRIVWSDRPQHEATVSWSTAEPGREHRVLLTPAAEPDAPPRVVPTHRDGAYTRHNADAAPPAWYHHARLVDLEPGTEYRVVLESDGVRSPTLRFRSAPDDERPLALLVGGDSRSGWRARCYLNLAIADLAAADEDGDGVEDLLAFSHGGDFVMYGPSWDDWTAWLTHHELTTTPDGRVLPLIPTRGNHDAGPLYDEVFDTPGGAGQNYFRTRLAADASLVTLNSNIPVAGDQLTWLDAELARAAEDSRWIVVSYHAALYPAVKPPAPAKAFWPPLFERYGVDLVLESDGHAIKRTPPIREDAVHPDGVVYLGEGGLGVPQRRPRTDPWFLQPPGMVTAGHHVIRLDLAREGLRARFLRMDEPPPPLDPEAFAQVVPPGARWSYLAADEAPEGWAAPGFDASAWPVGPAGFGFGDDDDATVLGDMRGNHQRVYVRTTFDAERVRGTRELSLMCRYDDGFVAYLNGVEVARAGVAPAAGGSRRGPKVTTHEARAIETFPLTSWAEHLRPGANVLALVGFNRMRNDKDFTLDPWLAGDPLDDAAGPQRPGLTTIDDTTRAPRAR